MLLAKFLINKNFIVTKPLLYLSSNPQKVSNSRLPCSQFLHRNINSHHESYSPQCLYTQFSHFTSQFSTELFRKFSVQNCINKDDEGPSPAFLYTFSGNQSCKAFLIFISQPPYNSVTNISNLTISEPGELARINNVTRKAMFPTNSEVIVPVNCYGQGQYYQSHTTYILKPNDTYFTVASNTYQGLSTCDSLMRENLYHQLNLIPNMVLQVPLRCACPTTNQIANGTMYLLTYLVNWDDTIPDIVDRFHVSTKSILEANGFPDENPNLTPSTTILIPLPTEPSSSETITHHQKPVMSGSFYNSKNKRNVYIVLAISLLIVLSVILAAVFLFYKKIFRRFRQKGCKDITVLGRQSNASLRRQSTASLRVEIADLGQD